LSGRSTRQRTAVAQALTRADGFRSAQDLHAAMRAGGEEVGLTTVYRTLTALAEQGAVDVLRTDDGEQVFRQCARGDHHHHLVCRSCGASVEVAGAAVEQWAAEVAQEHGFTDVSHTVEVFGTCRSCAAG